MKKLTLLLCFTLPLAAQPPAPAPEATIDQLKTAIQIVVKQRNDIAANLLDVQAQLQIVATENEALKKEIADLKAKLTDAAKPKGAPASDLVQRGPSPETSIPRPKS